MMLSTIRVFGWVRIWAVHPDARRELVFDDHNLIVNNGLVVVTELLGQLQSTANAPSVGYNAIASLYVGGRTTGSGSIAGATTPAATQTALQGTLIKRLPIVSVGVTFNATNKTVDFRATLGNADGNGNDIQEVALFTAGANVADPDAAAAASPPPRMFSRQVVGAIAKTNAISLDFAWRIGLSAG